VRHASTLGVPPPTDPHDRIESGRFLRSLLLRWLCVSVVAWPLVWIFTSLSNTWLIIGAVALVTLAADVLWLTYRVRRDQRRSTAR
jgi:membrane protein YdbS with pleckstrin-like domain